MAINLSFFFFIAGTSVLQVSLRKTELCILNRGNY
jgi:hypothetical protein